MGTEPSANAPTMSTACPFKPVSVVLPPHLKRWTNGVGTAAIGPSADPAIERPAPTRPIGQPDGCRARPNLSRRGHTRHLASRSEPASRAPKDPRPKKSETGVHRKGPRHQRCNGCQVTMTINPATGAVLGTIMHPAVWWIGNVEAAAVRPSTRAPCERAGNLRPRLAQPRQKGVPVANCHRSPYRLLHPC